MSEMPVVWVCELAFQNVRGSGVESAGSHCWVTEPEKFQTEGNVDAGCGLVAAGPPGSSGLWAPHPRSLGANSW